MKNPIEMFQNVRKGPKTTLVGALIMAFAGWMIYKAEVTLTYTSIEVVLFLLGTWLFLLSDDIFKKKGEQDEDKG